MKNKKGFLLAEETLKIVIAVICIGVLVSFLTSIYFAKVNDQKKKEAESTLDKINEEIVNLGGLEQKSYGIQNPGGWYLFSFVGNDKKPNSCADKNCLCICDNVYEVNVKFWVSEEERQLERCNEKGVCLIVSNIKGFEEIEIKKPKEGLTNILIQRVNNQIEIKEQ